MIKKDGITLEEKSVQLFKDAMANYPSGIVIITATNEQGAPIGIAANSFTSLSIDPLLVLWSIGNKSSSYQIFKKGTRFAVHLLAGKQSELVRIFSRKGIDRFSQIDWELSKNNLPIIKGAYATFECDTYETIEAGDHAIIIGSVRQIKTDIKNPLLYHQRRVGPLPLTFHGNI